MAERATQQSAEEVPLALGDPLREDLVRGHLGEIDKVVLEKAGKKKVHRSD
jgi:hypothetical protein